MKFTPLTWDWAAPQEDVPVPSDPTGIPVTLWLARLPENPATQRQLHALLAPDEHTRLARFQRFEDRQRYLTGRGLLRRLLAARLHRPAESLVIQTTSYGKPFIAPDAGTAPLHFNVSHSGDLVLIALSPSGEVGVDIEQEKPHHDLPALAERVFTPEDFLTWTHLPETEKTPAFYRLWTRHEAGLKALGHGFASASSPETFSPLNWFDLALPAGYSGSLALALPATSA